jgi:hypothetical protein
MCSGGHRQRWKEAEGVGGGDGGPTVGGGAVSRWGRCLARGQSAAGEQGQRETNSIGLRSYITP